MCADYTSTHECMGNDSLTLGASDENGALERGEEDLSKGKVLQSQ